MGETGTTLAVLAGRLDERSELAQALGRPESEAPADLLAAGFDRFGEALLGRLRGSFALALWSPTRAAGLLAVDQLGAGGLFTAAHGGGLLFATEIRLLLERLPGGPVVDRTGLVHWLADGTTEPGSTLLRGIRRLEGGQLIRLGAARPEPRTYWRPRYERPAAVSPSAAAEAVRDGLVTAARRPFGAGQAGVLLSGGVDSAAVAATARLARPDLRTYSAVFPEHRSVDESARIRETADVLGLRNERIAFRRGSILRETLAYLGAWRMPPASPNLFFHRPLLELARTGGTSLLLDGQGGDELFGRSDYLLADRIRHGRPGAALALARGLPEIDRDGVRFLIREFGVKGAVPGSVHRLARRLRPDSHYAPAWLTPAGTTAYAESGDPWRWKESSGPRWWAYLADLLTKGREAVGAHDFLRHMLAMHGLEGAQPLLTDVDLVERVLSLPPELAFAGDLDRPILRAALAPLLPESVRLRPSKAYFNDVFEETLNVSDWPAVTRLLGAPDALILDYVRRETLDELLASSPERRLRRTAWWIWRLVAAEAWLRTLADSRFPETAVRSLDLTEPEDELEASV